MFTSIWRPLAASLGAGAVITAAALVVAHPGDGKVGRVAESGDSATGTQYTQPTVPPMSLGASESPASATNEPATTKATPTVSAGNAAACADKGVVLPGGCH